MYFDDTKHIRRAAMPQNDWKYYNGQSHYLVPFKDRYGFGLSPDLISSPKWWWDSIEDLIKSTQV